MIIQACKLRHINGDEHEYGLYILTKDQQSLVLNQFGDRLIKHYYIIELMPEMFCVKLFEEVPKQ